jgi:hypothetical protein
MERATGLELSGIVPTPDHFEDGCGRERTKRAKNFVRSARQLSDPFAGYHGLSVGESWVNSSPGDRRRFFFSSSLFALQADIKVMTQICRDRGLGFAKFLFALGRSRRSG